MKNLIKKDIPLISVIVPVHNVEQYLSKCLDSILSSTVEDIEVILVEDCSTDNSKIICKEYAKNDSRVKLLSNIYNMGFCASRNFGLEKARGQYISFVDSDDYIAPDMYEKMLEAMERENISLVGCNAWNVDVDGSKQVIKYMGITEDKKVFFSQMGNKIYQSSFHIWRLLYKRDILQDIHFYEVPFLEDALFLIELYPLVNEAFFIAEPLYYYCKHYNTYSVRCRRENAEVFKVKDFAMEIFAKNPIYEQFKNGFWRWYTFNLVYTYSLVPLDLQGKYVSEAKKALPYKHYNVFLGRIEEFKHKYYLFGNIPVLTVEKKHGKKYVKLFGVVPLYKMKDYSL